LTNSKQKGKRGELELVKRLKDILPGKPWRRSQQFCGANGDADVVGVKDLHIECKRVEAGTKKVYDWLDQAERDARSDQVPVIMHKANLQPWLCIVPLDRLIELSAIIQRELEG
jgi:hypothetical protein